MGGALQSAIVDSETYVLACLRYIEANPLRARMVARPEDYPWSSYRHNALGAAEALLTPHETYSALGATAAERQAAYRALFAEGLDAALIDTLRDATQRGWAPAATGFANRSKSRSAVPPAPPGAAAHPRTARAKTTRTRASCYEESS